jgi:molybdopterin-guanine dinucleotide biosynthesis protein A
VGEVVVLAKADTALPSLPGVAVWVEPATPRHPLAGIMQALGLAAGRPVLICAADLPFVTSELVQLLTATDPGTAPAVIAACAGRPQPLLGCYQPRALDLLAQADRAFQRPLLETVAAISPRLVEVDDPRTLFNVNTPDDLLQAAAMIDSRKRAGISRR